VSALLPPDRFKKQPQYAARLNSANELSRYVEQAYFAAGWQLNDAGSARRSLANTGASLSPGREGPAFKTSGSTSSYFSCLSAALPRFSLEAFYTPNAAVNQYICGIQEAPNSTTHDRELRIDSSGKFMFYIYSGGLRQTMSTSNAVVNTPVHLLGISDGKNIHLYVNGVLEASMAAGEGYGGYASPEFVIGTGQTDAGAQIPGSGWLNYAIYYNKALSAPEARARYDNKYSILQAPARLLFRAAGTYNLVATACIQSNTGSTPTITQNHAVAAIESAQANAGGTAAVNEVHRLAGAAGLQGNAASPGAITYSFVLAGGGASQNNIASNGAIVAIHALVVAKTPQGNTSGIAGITRNLVVAAASLSQANAGSTGILALAPGSGLPVAAPAAQENNTSAGPIIQAHILAAASFIQRNSISAGRINGGITVEPALVVRAAKTISLKKPGIPAGTPDWLKTTMEILTGRRGNRIEAPKFQRLTFSETPTQSECQALYSYTNAVREALEQVISRMDG
jgi:hypothetical protein